MRRNFALLFNDSAGVGQPRRLARVLAHLKSAGARVKHLNVAGAEDATRLVAEIAKAGTYDAVIAAGGDGTVRAAAAGAAGTPLPVGYIPLGTGNVLRHEIGLSKRSSEIARVLLEGSELEARLGTVNGAPFFLMVGAGFDARAVAVLDQDAKRRLGRLAYGRPIMKAMTARPERMEIEIDGVQHHASWVIVTKASHYGGSFALTRETRLGKKQMLAVLVKGETQTALVRAALLLALGRLSHAAGVETIPCTRVRISSENAVPLQADGDAAGTTPCEIFRDGPFVRFLVPNAYVAGPTNRHTNHLLYKS